MSTQKSLLWWFGHQVRMPARSPHKDVIWVYQAGEIVCLGFLPEHSALPYFSVAGG